MKHRKAWAYGAILGGGVVAALAFGELSRKVERAYKPAGEYVPPTLADLDRWNANDVRRHFESRGIVLPQELPGITLANGRYFSREEIYGNPLLNELGLGRMIYRAPESTDASGATEDLSPDE
ncbi:hypothetical protein [Candidatus Foliamicus sp.]